MSHQSSQFVSRSCNLWYFAAYSQATAYLHCTDQYGHCCMPATSLSAATTKLLIVVHRVSKPLYDCLAKRYLPGQVVKATQLTAEKVCFQSLRCAIRTNEAAILKLLLAHCGSIDEDESETVSALDVCHYHHQVQHTSLCHHMQHATPGSILDGQIAVGFG